MIFWFSELEIGKIGFHTVLLALQSIIFYWRHADPRSEFFSNFCAFFNWFMMIVIWETVARTSPTVDKQNININSFLKININVNNSLAAADRCRATFRMHNLRCLISHLIKCFFVTQFSSIEEHEYLIFWAMKYLDIFSFQNLFRIWYFSNFFFHMIFARGLQA